MLAFFNSLILFFAAPTGADPDSTWGRFLNFFNSYLNYPGFEAWRFFNLAIFLAILIYLLRKPLTEAFKARRETIRAELIRAEEEKRAAMEQLATMEARLARLDAESAELLAAAKTEADEEKARILRQTEFEISKIREQAAGEIDRKQKQVEMGLRRYSAEESVRRAEEKIRQNINIEKDARLVKANINSIGGLN